MPSVPRGNTTEYISRTYSHIEIVVIDDGPTDGTADVIRCYGERVRPEFGPNRGVWPKVASMVSTIVELNVTVALIAPLSKIRREFRRVQ